MLDNPDKVDLRRKKSISTKKQLIQATINVIAEKGLAGTTLTTVSKESGFARSSVGFHFKSINQMLNETLQFLLDEYKAGWMQIFEQQELSPTEKIMAIIDWDLGPIACTPKKVAIWFAYWGEISTQPIYRQLVTESDNQYHYNLESLVFELTNNKQQAEIIATGLGSMIIGMWMDFHLYRERFNRDLAKQTCYSYISTNLSGHSNAN